MRAIDLFAGAGGFSTGAAMADGEHWLPIADFPGYEISSHGRARAVRTGRILAQSVPKNGYALLHLRNTQGRRALLVNRLVLETFVGPCPPGWEASHLNGDRANNRRTNLEWESPDDNRARKRLHGTTTEGSKHPQAVLNEESVASMRDLYAAGGVSQSQLAAQFGVSRSVAGAAVRGAAWRNVAIPRPVVAPLATGEIACACGCGRGLTPKDGRGRPRRVLHGHRTKA